MIVNISFSCNDVFYESNKLTSPHNRIINLYSKYIVCDRIFLFCLRLLQKYIQFQKDQYTGGRLSVTNATQCFPLLYLSLRIMTHAPSFIESKLSFDKKPLNLGS